MFEHHCTFLHNLDNSIYLQQYIYKIKLKNVTIITTHDKL